MKLFPEISSKGKEKVGIDDSHTLPETIKLL